MTAQLLSECEGGCMYFANSAFSMYLRLLHRTAKRARVCMVCEIEVTVAWSLYDEACAWLDARLAA